MNIDTSLLGPEITQIVQYPYDGTKHSLYEAILHTVDHDIILDTIISVENMRDYNSNISDYTLITFMLPLGDFVKTIYPRRNNLELTLVKIAGGIETEERLKLVLSNNNTNVDGGRYNHSSLEELNKLEYVRVEAQCVNRITEVFRTKTTCGVFSGTTVEQVILSVIKNESTNIELIGEPLDLNISVIDPDNKRVYDNIIIPDGTKVLNLPSYLQNIDYGVYNGNIGTYLQRYKDKETLFIYPLYKCEIVDTAKDKLIVYGVPSKKYEYIDRTYLVDGDSIKILTGDSDTRVNKGENEFMNTGVGFNTTDANSIMNRNVTIQSDGVLSDRAEVTNDVVLKERDDGLNTSTTVGITDNLYKERSKILKQTGTMIQIKWNFSNDDLLRPGMAVLYVYIGDNNKVVTLRGVLQSVFTMTNISRKMTASILNVFTERPEDIEE